MATLTDLLTVPTSDDVLQKVIESVQKNGLPVTDWAVGGAARTILQATADGLLDFGAGMVPVVAGAGHLEYAPGIQGPNYPSTPDWLGEITAPQLYDLTRIAAQPTIGNVVLTAATGQGPYTIAVGQLWITGPSGNQYTNTTGGTVPLSGSLTVQIQSIGPGAQFSDAYNTLTILQTPLPGLSVNNPRPDFSSVTHAGSGTGTVTLSRTTSATPTDGQSIQILITTSGGPGTATFSYSINSGRAQTVGVSFDTILFLNAGYITSNGMTFDIPGTGTRATFGGTSWTAGDTYAWNQLGSWMTQQGADAEPDAALIARCKARWPSLGQVPTEDVIVLLAKAASTSVTRVLVAPDPTIGGQVDVWIAGPAGGVSGSALANVSAFVNARLGITQKAVVASATTLWINVGGLIIVSSSQLAAAQAQAPVNVALAVNNMPLGGTLYTSDIIAAIQNAPGVIGFENLDIQTSTTNPQTGFTDLGNVETIVAGTGQALVFANLIATWQTQ